MERTLFDTHIIHFIEIYFNCCTSDAQSIFDEHIMSIDLGYVNQFTPEQTIKAIHKADKLVHEYLH